MVLPLAELPDEEVMDRMPVQAEAYGPVLKVVRCLFIEELQDAVFQTIRLRKNMNWFTSAKLMKNMLMVKR